MKTRSKIGNRKGNKVKKVKVTTIFKRDFTYWESAIYTTLSLSGAVIIISLVFITILTFG